MDTNRIRELCDARDKIDEELANLITGKEKKQNRCSVCLAEGHSSRTCPKKAGDKT